MRLQALVLLFSLSLALPAIAADENQYSVDANVRALAKVKLFAFDVIAMSGKSSGETLVSRILKKDDAIKYLVEVYNRGTPEAKVYALASFHYLAPELFEICRKDIVGKYNPVVHSMEGCLVHEGSLLEFVMRAEHGQYDAYIRKYAGG